MDYEDVSEYVRRLVGEGDKLQIMARDRSSELAGRGVFAIDPPRGRLIELLTRLRRPRWVLEIGSGAGYSALWLLKGMGPKSRLDAIERDPEVASVFREHIRDAGATDRVRIHTGPALSILKGLRGPYDLVFIDADKAEYPAYLEEALRLTRRGSIIAADNMLWGGSIIAEAKRPGVEEIREYTRRIFNDPRLSSLIIPLGDGVAVSYRMK